MRRDSLFTDFTICSHEGNFPCHKVIVAALSPYLKALLTSDMLEICKREVHLKHMKGEIIELVLTFIYCGQVVIDNSQLMDMLKAAHYLQIQQLIEMCVAEAPARFTAHTVLAWLELAHTLELDDLQAHSVQFMIENFTDVFNEEAFLSFRYVGVVDFFSKLQGATVNHDAMVKAAMRWVSHDTGSRTQHMEEIMEKVSLEKCSLPALIDVMGKYGAVIGPNLSTLNMVTTAIQKLALPQDEERDVKKEETKTVAVTPPTPPAHKQTTAQKTGRTRKAKQVLVIVGGDISYRANRVCWKMNERRQLEKLTEIPYDDLSRFHSVCPTDGGFIVTGGQNSDICYIYTAATMSWRRMREMLRKRDRHGSICIKGVLYVLGGVVSGKWTDSVECLVLAENQWQTGHNLPQCVIYPKVAEINDRLYLLDPNTRKLYQLDAVNKVWTERAPIPRCDISVSMTSVKGKLAVMGGQDRICALYDPTTDVWTEGQQPTYQHIFGSLVYHDDRLLMGGASWYDTDAVEEYSLDDGTWSATDIKMPARLNRHYALVVDSLHNG